MKKIICLILCLIICSASTISAFADDVDIPEESQDSSGDYVIITPSKQFNDEFKALDNAIKATTYTINDLYLLTYDIFYNTAGSSPVNEIVTIRQRVNTINTGVITINTNLTNLLDAINPDFATTGLSLYDLMRSTYSSLFDVDPNDGSISMFEYLLYIYTELEDATTSLNSIISHISTVESYIDGVEGHLQLANSKLNSMFSTLSNIKTDTGNLYYDVENILDIQNIIENYIEDFHDLYASQDIIDAKEDQQPLEDQIIGDFTGNGSASASVGDAVDAKNISGQMQDALATGASASGLSTILSTSNPGNSNSYFSFFTQDVYNDLNGVNNIPQTRDNVYINILDSNNYDLQQLIRGSSW